MSHYHSNEHSCKKCNTSLKMALPSEFATHCHFQNLTDDEKKTDQVTVTLELGVGSFQNVEETEGLHKEDKNSFINFVVDTGAIESIVTKEYFELLLDYANTEVVDFGLSTFEDFLGNQHQHPRLKLPVRLFNRWYELDFCLHPEARINLLGMKGLLGFAMLSVTNERLELIERDFTQRPCPPDSSKCKDEPQI